MHEVLAFLKAAQTFYLATDDGGQPRVRPFGAACAYEDKLYLVTGNQKDVFKQLQANPKLEICAMSKGGEWLRVTATAVFDARREPRVKMLEEYPSLTGMYSADGGIMEVCYLKDATATFATFTSEPRTVTF